MAKTKSSKRQIVACMYNMDKELVWKRYYARIDTAVRRSVQVAMLEAYPGEVVEFSSRDFGYQIGTVKMQTMGRIQVDWTPLTNGV